MSNRIFWSLLFLVIAGPALAGDGYIQINQQRALAGGVSAGDTPGFPVTLSQPGVYILTSSLTAPNQNTNIIEITSDLVRVDMNGFAIVGTALCATPPTCINTGTGIGISSSTNQIGIVNGLITGMGSHGISLVGLGMVLREVGVTHNGGIGLNLGSRAFLYDVLVGFNGGTGISGGLGINLNDSSSGINGVSGVVVGDGAMIKGGGFSGNVLGGIVAGQAAIIENVNTNSNGGDGIAVSYASLIKGCLSSGNGGTGIVFPSTVGSTASGYKDCVISLNSVATVSGSEGAEIGTNLCGTNSTCP